MSLPKNYHKIYLFKEPFDKNDILSLCKELDEANTNPNVKEILLIINSAGGSGGRGGTVALHDYIKLSTKPVDTLACGFCGSGAITILQAGRKRYSTSNTVFLIHQGSGGPEIKKLIHLDELVNNLKKELEPMRKIDADRIGIPLDEYMSATSFENIMTVDEALKFNLIDEIV